MIAALEQFLMMAASWWRGSADAVLPSWPGALLRHVIARAGLSAQQHGFGVVAAGLGLFGVC
jgi:hypothetical protein